MIILFYSKWFPVAPAGPGPAAPRSPPGAHHDPAAGGPDPRGAPHSLTLTGLDQPGGPLSRSVCVCVCSCVSVRPAALPSQPPLRTRDVERDVMWMGAQRPEGGWGKRPGEDHDL